MQKYILKLLPLTGIHIGTGDELTPFDYTISQLTNRPPVLQRFNMEKAISVLEPAGKKNLMEILDKGNITDLRGFFRKNTIKEALCYTMPVSETIADASRENLLNPNNKLAILETYRSRRSWTPVIPGSSIKGAIRTAVLSERAKAYVNPNHLRTEAERARGSDRFFQQAVLESDSERNDPFRTLTLRDILLKGDKNQIALPLELYRIKRDGAWGFESIQIFAEVIRGTLMGGNAFGMAHLITHEELPGKGEGLTRWTPIRSGIGIDEIVTACNSFYQRSFLCEYEKFYAAQCVADLRRTMDVLNQEVEHIDASKRQFLLRIGRWSQVESVTVEEYRRPQARKGYGKTRTLAAYNDNHFPLGWTVAQIF